MNCVAMGNRIAYGEYANKIIAHKLVQNEMGVYKKIFYNKV